MYIRYDLYNISDLNYIIARTEKQDADTGILGGNYSTRHHNKWT